MRDLTRHLALVAATTLFAWAGACGDDKENPKDTSTPTDSATSNDGSDTSVTPDTTEETDTGTPPTDTTVAPDVPDTVETTYATATFFIDDRNDQTYDATDGLAWKGSFSYDKDTNVLSLNGAWTGPFVPLYDDGAAPTGHEAPGATAGDHIWSVAVKIATPEANTDFEYGAIRGSVDGGDGQWIWVGANGKFTVPAGSTGQIDAAGLVLPKSGTIDLQLNIDVSDEGANLNAAFQGIEYSDVKVKGSAWGWTEVAMVDDGTKGDATSGDGIYTFRLSENLGKHDGLLKTGDKPEFIFVLGGVEYKADGAAATEGVTAATSGSGVVWVDAEVEILESNKNSYVDVPFYPPADTVEVDFTIDDSANGTYDDTDGLAWKGSFKYDPDTRILTKDASWGGPFAILYDDGPWNEGGHEPAGSAAGDHKWGIAAFVSNTADDTFEYGAIRGSVAGADGQWIWVGGNGTFAVVKDSTTAIVATGLVIPLFGTIDLVLVIDVSNHGANLIDAFDLSALDPPGDYQDVKVKGSAWGWTEIALSDDGTGSDLGAGDGKFTFRLSKIIGKHDGLLKVGDQPEFIFVLDGSEYKDGGAGAQAGVSAYSDFTFPSHNACDLPGDLDCDSELLEINGSNGNTMITVGD